MMITLYLSLFFAGAFAVVLIFSLAKISAEDKEREDQEQMEWIEKYRKARR